MEAEQIILDASLRPTKARVAVLNALLNSSTALSHTDILATLQGVKEIDRVTVYRVLDWLLEHGLIHKIFSEDRAWKFQFNAPKRTYQAVTATPASLRMQNHGHAHLHCQRCGTVLCIHELAAHIPQAILETYQVSHIEISLKGICPECQPSSS
jgi:Fur family transcriptional regulator, ferric uptake regulator